MLKQSDTNELFSFADVRYMMALLFTLWDVRRCGHCNEYTLEECEADPQGPACPAAGQHECAREPDPVKQQSHPPWTQLLCVIVQVACGMRLVASARFPPEASLGAICSWRCDSINST